MEVSLSQLLGQVKRDHQEAFENAKAGIAPSGDWANAGDLPTDREYRVVVDSADYGKSKTSGKTQMTLVYKVVEPAEFEGKKFSDYQALPPTTTVGSEVFAKTIGALQASMDGYGDDFAGFVKQFEGNTAVVALRIWGQEADRIGVRYINADHGQTLSTKVSPPRTKRDTSGLRPEVVIPKGEPFPETPTITPPTVTPEAANPATPPSTAGVNLPPGLRPS
jgi:hypothetical protein